MEHDHSHDHHDHGSDLSEMQLRVRALESILLEKGYIEPAALDELIETYEKKIGPRNGARVVAKAWVDPTFRQWLLTDGTAAIGRSVTGAGLAIIWSHSKIRHLFTTSSFAHSAPATLGRYSVCR